MKVLTIIVRVLFGLMFVVFGSNAFLHFMPMPPMTGYPAQFIGSMNASGYLMGVAAVQVIGGLLVLIGRFVPLGLTFLAPVVVNIVFYHLFMDHAGLGMAAVVTAMLIFLLWRYWVAFAALVRP